ncbi:MAG: hypothetical protein Q4C41_02155, partial [Eggerthellaceae bacterium]|nr:hypothetical protein [Eggerthellaceae bacterium]
APLDLHPFIITCLPLLEIPFARLSTPRHFADLRDVPVFANVPVRGGSLSVRLAASMLLFGLALGMLSSMTAVSILRGQDAAVAMVAILLASVPTAAFLMLVLRHGGDGRWDFLMRPLLLLVALTSFAAPLLMDENPLVALFVRYAGYLCFEASMWVFFAGVAQGFRLSPVFMVGVGRGALSLGTLAGMCLMASHSTVESLLPYGWPGVLILVLLGLIAGYVMLPRFDAMRKAVAKGSGVAGAE